MKNKAEFRKDNQPALHHATLSRAAGTSKVQLLLDRGADIEARDKHGYTALHYACGSSYSNKDTIQLLLDRGADIKARDNDGRTALHHASLFGPEGAEQLLLDRGADIKVRDNKGRTALHYAVWNDAELETWGDVQLLLDRGADIKVRDNEGQTALHRAVWNDKYTDEPIIELLLDRGADISVRDNKGRTALHHAFFGHDDCRVHQLLLDRGADISVRDNEGQTALHYASERGEKKTVNLLLDRGADIKAQDKSGLTALHCACLRGRNIVQRLLDCTIEILLWPQNFLFDKYREVNLLLNCGMGRISAQGEYDSLFLTNPFAGDFKGTVQLLLDRGADISVRDRDGETALCYAKFTAQKKIIKILKKKSLKPYQESLALTVKDIVRQIHSLKLFRRKGRLTSKERKRVEDISLFGSSSVSHYKKKG